MNKKLLMELIERYDLTEEEAHVLEYFLKNISVGEILAIRELMALYNIKEPFRIILRLIKKGLLVKGLGCYNLSPDIRRSLRMHKLR